VSYWRLCALIALLFILPLPLAYTFSLYGSLCLCA